MLDKYSTTSSQGKKRQEVQAGARRTAGAGEYPAHHYDPLSGRRADGIAIADAIMFLSAGSASANSVTWDPALAGPAQYEVYAKWTAHANRATDATYTVHHAAGASSVTVNQQTNGGIWNLLGTFDLDGASTVVLADEADGIVVADAVRLVQVSAPPPAATGIFYVHTQEQRLDCAASRFSWERCPPTLI